MESELLRGDDPLKDMSVLEKLRFGLSNITPSPLGPVDEESNRPIKRATGARSSAGTPPNSPQTTESAVKMTSPNKQPTTVLGLQKSVSQRLGFEFYTGLPEPQQDAFAKGVAHDTVMPRVAQGLRHEVTPSEQDEHFSGALPFTYVSTPADRT